MEHSGLVRLVVPNRVDWCVGGTTGAHVVEVVVGAGSLHAGSTPRWEVILVVGEVQLVLGDLPLQCAPHHLLLLVLRDLALWWARSLGWPLLSGLPWLFFRVLKRFLLLRRGLLSSSHSFLDGISGEVSRGGSHVDLLEENIGGWCRHRV